MPTLSDIIRSMPKSKSRYDLIGNPAAYFFARPISYPITLLFLKARLSANSASILSIFFALAASYSAAVGYSPITITAFVASWLILDCVDGNIARYSKTGSRQGEFLDAIGGYIVSAGIYLGIGYGSSDYNTLLLGAISSIFSILSRLILNKYNVLSGSTRNSSGDTGSGWKAAWLLSIYNLSGIGLPIMFLSLYIGMEKKYLIIQSTLGLLITLGVIAKSYRNLRA